MSLRYALTGKRIPPTVWGKSRTRQSEMKFADINLIMKKYEAAGALPQVGDGFYADVSAVGDFREAMERVQRGDDMFMTLPADVRKEFDNDPVLFVDAVTEQDTAKRDVTMQLLIDKGVKIPDSLVPAAPVVPDPVVVVPPVAD